MNCRKVRLEHMQWRGLFVFVLARIYMVAVVKAATPSVATCPQYVAENGTLVCTCHPQDCDSPYTLYWLGYNPDSEILVVPAVKREDERKQYTCQLTCGSQISTAYYTLKVAYGPNSHNVSILGDIPFKTDGTKVLNLTCLAKDVYPDTVYSWEDSLCNNTNGSTCSFVPKRDDDMKIVTCYAHNSGATRLHVFKDFTIVLQYPPPGDPHIQRTGQVHKSGDTLSCTVRGGKPPVEKVTFYCTNQVPGDRGVLVNGSVTSTLRLDTSQATDDNMTCHCSGYWAPEPGYYTNRESANFRTEYPVKMKAFTMNKQFGTVTVNDKTNVTLLCEAHGLPPPNITLQGPHDDDLTGNLTHANETHSKMEHTIVAVTDTHMGNYTCIAKNNVGKNADTSIFILNVNFPPRLNPGDGLGHSPETPVNMPEWGINIEVRAYPTPDSFRFASYADNSDHSGNELSTDSSMFTATASQRGPGSPEVTCHIRPGQKVQKGWLYMVTISNGFGMVQYYFNVTGVPSPPVTEASPNSKDVGSIVGGVMGGIIALVIVVVLVVVVWKRKYRRYEKPQHRRDQDSSPYTGLQPMQGTDQRLSAGYENSPQNVQSPSPTNYADMAAASSTQPSSAQYVNTQFKRANNSSSANYANTELRPDLAQSSGEYVNLETKSNYEKVQLRTETQANVYKTLNTSR